MLFGAFCCCCFCILCVSGGNTQNEIGKVERNVLTDFYHSTKGESWLRSDNWLIGYPCGDDGSNNQKWFSLSCAGRRVVSINMKGNNMSGTLTYSLADLSNLSALVLSNNQIGGEIPPGLFESRIRVLDLHNNSFTGSLGDEVCSPLFNLSSNHFSCPLPTCCTSCSEPCVPLVSSPETDPFVPTLFPSPSPSPFYKDRNSYLPIWAISIISVTALAAFVIFVYFAYVCWHITESQEHHRYTYRQVN